MKFMISLLSVLAVVTAAFAAQSTDGILDLVKRRLPEHVDSFEFRLHGNSSGPISSTNQPVNDEYVISSASQGKILVEGNSPMALASGLHRYLTDIVQVDIFWYVGSRLDQAPLNLPPLDVPISGSSIVPLRYHFNTVTFSYTTAFWSWEDWELELDWLALRGVNLPLAWVGYEKILIDVYRELGLTDAEILNYFSGPAFQSWNRFGNIQGSWGGEIPMEWIDSQFELQRNITRRMVELGMTPVLPAFTGFVPRATRRVLPNAAIVNGSQWAGMFPVEYTNVTFLEPVDPAFADLQRSFISKQTAALGNITHVYTLDQFNENNPETGDLDYLKSVSASTWKSLKAADPESIWLMQGWLFVANAAFWDNSRIEAYLGGVENDSDMLILDLYSESIPQWQRTDSYFGKPWIWCQLHDYGQSMGLYGQIENLTVNPIEALVNSSSLVGFGLTMEGQEGNEIVYDLLLDQAWSRSPIDTVSYFHNWVSRRYAGTGEIPDGLYEGWETMRFAVYNNTNLTSAPAVTRSILVFPPSISGLVNLTFQVAATTVNYDPAVLRTVWNTMFDASKTNPSLWDNPSYQHDMTDITRQVLENSFIPAYTALISAYTSPTPTTNLTSLGSNLTSILQTLDKVLLTNPSFNLQTYLDAARASAPSPDTQDFFEYNLRTQITLWGPSGEISDYASKSWGGLVKGYYLPRWEIFIAYLEEVPVSGYNGTAFRETLRVFETKWGSETSGRGLEIEGSLASLQSVLEGLEGNI